MPHDAALETLLTHDRWATSQLLTAARPLSDKQLDRVFEIGLGSLRKTLAHTIEVIDGWHSATSGRERMTPFAATASVAEKESRFSRVHDAFAEACREADSAETGATWTAVYPTHTFTAPAVVIATHVITHSMHHRAQALNILRHLGVTPLPKSSVTEWAIATGVAQSTHKQS